MKKLLLILLLTIPFIGFGQVKKPYKFVCICNNSNVQKDFHFSKTYKVNEKEKTISHLFSIDITDGTYFEGTSKNFIWKGDQMIFVFQEKDSYVSLEKFDLKKNILISTTYYDDGNEEKKVWNCSKTID